MAMYEDLVKQLRYCADATTCRNCFWKTECCPTDMQKKAADAIEELRKAVLRLENESGIYDELPTVYIYPTKWVPVAERLPEEKINPYTHDFEPIICSTNFGDVRVYKYGTPTGWDEPHFWNGAGIVDWYVTHWMPLPEPPKDGE